MKRFLFALIFSSAIFTNLFSEESCNDFLDFDWHWIDRNLERVNESKAWGVQYNFKSTSKKSIRIHRINLKTAEKDIVIQEQLDGGLKTYIRPFGKQKAYIAKVNELNLDVVKFAGYACTFEEKPIAKKKKYKSKQKSWSQKMLDKIRGN